MEERTGPLAAALVRAPPRLLSAEENPLSRPVEADRCDEERQRHTHPPPVPHLVAKAADGEEGSDQDQELTALDSGIETEERHEKVTLG